MLLVIIVIMLLAITVAASAFNACQLSGTEWLVCVVIALANLPIVFVYRIASRMTHSYYDKRNSKIVSDDEIYYIMDEGKRQSEPSHETRRKSRKLSKVILDVEAQDDSARNSRSSSVVEIFRKIKVDSPMPMKSKSIASLRQRGPLNKSQSFGSIRRI